MLMFVGTRAVSEQFPMGTGAIRDRRLCDIPNRTQGRIGLSEQQIWRRQSVRAFEIISELGYRRAGRLNRHTVPISD